MKYFHLIMIVLSIIFHTDIYGQNKKDRPTTYKDDFVFNWNKSSDSTKLIATSKIYAPIEIIVSERETGKELNSLLLNPFDSLIIFEFESKNVDSLRDSVNTKLKISYYIGHPDLITPDENYPYRLPYKKGKKYEVSQGWNGKRTHKGIASKYAIDFRLSVGDPIYAARGGIVVKAIDWFTKQGGPELRSAANKIIILHDDGTLASYAHLIYKGVLVKEGDKVEVGQKIGFSGLTGYTNGTHLHFVVRKERDISIPTYFRGYGKKELKMGKKYKVK